MHILFDILNPYSTQSFNLYFAHKFGLEVAIYLNAIMEYQRAYIGTDDYFEINRQYLQARTTLTEKQQKKVEDTLYKLEILLTQDDKVNINYDILVELSTTTDTEVSQSVNQIKKNATKKDKSFYGFVNVRKRIDKLNVDDDVKESLKQWLEAVYGKFGFVNKVMEQSAVDFILPILQTDKEKALQIIKISTVNAYKEMQWGLNKYNSMQTIQDTQANVKTTVLENKNDSDVQWY